MIAKRVFKNIIALPLLAIVLFSCDNIRGDYKVVESFPLQRKLQVNLMTDYDSEIGLISLSPAGKYIIGTKRKLDFFFTVYDRSHNRVVDICRRGNGPNEFLAPAYFSQYSESNGETKIWVLERAKSYFVLINIDKTVQSGKIEIEKRIDLSKTDPFLEPRNVFYINDDLVVGTSDIEDCKLFALNLTDGTATFSGHTRAFPNNTFVHDISQNMMTLKPDQTKLASVFFSIPQMDLYKVSVERYMTVFDKKIVNPESLTIENIDDIYFSQIHSTDKYIYALYCEAVGEDSYDNHVLVFDWAGQPVAKLKVPKVDDFFVDEATRRLYIINNDTDKNIVCWCELP